MKNRAFGPNPDYRPASPPKPSSLFPSCFQFSDNPPPLFPLVYHIHAGAKLSIPASQEKEVIEKFSFSQ
ncbi:hypothetical protein SLE2022_223360 [Rubroshorea leprosula]